ncbi:MAG: tRNA (adenosine(37)-N6)-threonylcarbamoyltransferase complex dimerization subunit type 1 TsaB [Verrucomicrobia bacterium]|nr:tRNA (adenosine(37)-N6)-threonylcarbamoyltransferase complex dimerization subunit type 1 TsaB [Verrucomicrobiota bacterium]
MFLIIDTATSRGLIALCDDNEVLFEKALPLGLSNSRLLEPALLELLALAGITAKELDFVAVGIGPGSYTGLRVGAASAKGLSLGCGIPLVGVPSLHGFIPPVDGSFVAVVDAKIGGVYLQYGVKNSEGVQFIGEPRLESIEKFAENLQTIVTPAWEPLSKRLEGISLPQIFEVGPSAEQLRIEAKEKFYKKEYSLDGSLSLLYLRQTQAEIDQQSR